MVVPFSNLGVGSGLPLDKLLADLRTNESRALGVIKTRYDATQSRISAYAALKAAVETVKTAGEALSKENVLGAVTVSSTGDSFTAAASAKAITGQYKIEVKSLASTQTLTSKGRADSEAKMAGGRITVTLANGKQGVLDLSGQIVSMRDVAEAINKDGSLGIRATLLNDGSAAPHRLLLSSSQTGTDAAVASITVDGSPDNDLRDLLGFDAQDVNPNPDSSGMTERVAARNAQVEIDGIAVSSASNTLKDAIAGVTLNLTRAGAAQTLTLARDDAQASTAVKGFVAAWNALQASIARLTAFDVTKGSSSPLTGDAVARRVQNVMRDALDVKADKSGEKSGLKSLSQIGITTDPVSGQLKIDDKKLAEALKDNLPQVQELLVGEDADKRGGLLGQMQDAIATINGREGMITVASEGAQRSANLLDTEYQATSERIEQRMETYRQQFVALDASVAKMSAISNYLSQQLAMLGNVNGAKGH